MPNRWSRAGDHYGDSVFETASWGRRILALAVDWIASWAVVVAVFGRDSFGQGGDGNLWVIPVFVVESALLTALAGGSFGQLATRLRVVRADGTGRPIDLVRALVRQALVAVVLPPLIFKPDGRGVHDMVAGSATVTLDVWRRQLGAAS